MVMCEFIEAAKPGKHTGEVRSMATNARQFYNGIKPGGCVG